MPLSADQSPAVTGPAVRTQRPSGLNSASLTAPKWPRSVCRRAPDLASQIRAVVSRLAVTTNAPSGENRTEVTGFACPRNTTSVPPGCEMRTSLPSIVATAPAADVTGGTGRAARSPRSRPRASSM